MKESGKTTSKMDAAKSSGPMALRTMVSVGLVQNHDCFISFRLMRVVDLYKGWLVDGTREGFGAHVSPSGLEYEGEWKDNKQDGKGKMKWPDGDMYEGECRGGAHQDWFPWIDVNC